MKKSKLINGLTLALISITAFLVITQSTTVVICPDGDKPPKSGPDSIIIISNDQITYVDGSDTVLNDINVSNSFWQ